MPPPQRRRWILGLFQFIVAFVLALPIGLLAYSHFFPEQWATKSDAVIQGYVNSFRYYATGGVCGETLVQRQKRLVAEAERQLQEKRKKEEELKRLKREEERLKKLEERKRKKEADEAWRRAETLAESRMTPLQCFLYRNNIGNRRFKRYRRP
jgi:cell shape-determining protein MreC